MLKKTIKYKDYDGVERVEDFYFNLNETEVIKLEMSKQGGIDKYINRIIRESDMSKIIDLFDEIIKLAYGEKSADGRRFIKNQEVYDNFRYSPAYNEVFMELVGDEKKQVEFINGVVSPELKMRLDELKKNPEKMKEVEARINANGGSLAMGM